MELSCQVLDRESSSKMPKLKGRTNCYGQTDGLKYRTTLIVDEIGLQIGTCLKLIFSL